MLTANILLKVPILMGARAIIIVHNHPGGIARPSAEDITLTKAAQKYGECAGIPVVDHVIIGAHDFFSFSSEGRL
jgi:DNA repair protein RadC